MLFRSCLPPEKQAGDAERPASAPEQAREAGRMATTAEKPPSTVMLFQVDLLKKSAGGEGISFQQVSPARPGEGGMGGPFSRGQGRTAVALPPSWG